MYLVLEKKKIYSRSLKIKEKQDIFTTDSSVYWINKLKLGHLNFKNETENKLPFMPNVGPCEGWRKHPKTFFFKCAPRAWHKPTVVVLLPSPKGVGVMLQKNGTLLM